MWASITLKKEKEERRRRKEKEKTMRDAISELFNLLN